MIIELPWEPTQIGKAISENIRRYGIEPEDMRVLVGIEIYPPDFQDIWDVSGAILDGIIQVGLIQGAWAIDRMVIERKHSVDGGMCRLFISPNYGA